MPDTLDPDVAEWKARALARSDRPDLVEAADWPTSMPTLAAAADRAVGRWTVQGGDWSHYQGPNLDVRRLGVQFGWFKAGEGNGSDPTYQANRARSIAGGIPTHGYWFMHPREDPVAVIDRFRRVAGPAVPGRDALPMLDIELPGFTPRQVATYIGRHEAVFSCLPILYMAEAIYNQPGMAAACAGCRTNIPRYGGQPRVRADVWQNSDKGPGGGDSDLTSDLALVLVTGSHPPPPDPFHPHPPVFTDHPEENTPMQTIAVQIATDADGNGYNDVKVDNAKVLPVKLNGKDPTQGGYPRGMDAYTLDVNGQTRVEVVGGPINGHVDATLFVMA